MNASARRVSIASAVCRPWSSESLVRTARNATPVSVPTESAATSPARAPACPAMKRSARANVCRRRPECPTDMTSVERNRKRPAGRSGPATDRAGARAGRPVRSAIPGAATEMATLSPPASATAMAPARYRPPSLALRPPASRGACLNSCSSSSTCAPGQSCVGGSCGPRGNGQDCTDGSACASGHCVDGVCCESACTGRCTFCATPESRGRCVQVGAGARDPRAVRGETDPTRICVDQDASSCGTNGRCDGQGGCQRYPDNTVCGQPRCNGSSNSETEAGRCDDGVCRDGAEQVCAPFRGCSGNRCRDTCSNDSQCTNGNVCLDGDCQEPPDNGGGDNGGGNGEPNNGGGSTGGGSNGGRHGSGEGSGSGSGEGSGSGSGEGSGSGSGEGNGGGSNSGGGSD